MRHLALITLVVGCAWTAAAATRPVLIWMEGEPLAEFSARQQAPFLLFRDSIDLQSRSLDGHRAELRRNREAAVDALKKIGFVFDRDTDVVLHAVIGRLPEESLEAARAVPGVRQVRWARYYYPLMNAAAPLVRADQVWPWLGGENSAGRGVRIGIIDSGVDINHPMLQDAGLPLPEGFPKGESEFTNSKIIVARNYLRLIGDPREEPTAMDRDGHGTFVAAIAAGRRALGPRAEISGIAPGAQLGIYRVFPSVLNFGATTEGVIIAAINDAVADGMNVLNLSFGATAMDLPSEEPIPQAIRAAVRAGVVVVASAGNGGTFDLVGEPANVPEAITAGATTSSRIFAYPLRVTGPAPVPEELQRIAAVPALSNTATVTSGPATLAFVNNACNPITPADTVRGKLVIVTDESRCSRTTKARNVTQAGASAMIIARTDDLDARNFAVSGSFVPLFQISRTQGDSLINFAASGQAQAMIESTWEAFSIVPDRLTFYSSRGPSNALDLKPDICAPGTPIYSAYQMNDAMGDMYSTDAFGTAEGTSFSAPIVAGAAALLKQARPEWTPAQIKSALVNSAAPTVREEGATAPMLGCPGRLDVVNAIGAAAVFDPTGISFSGWIARDGLTVRRPLRITNLSNIAESYSIEVLTRSAVTNGTMTVEPASTAAIAARDTGTVDVVFQAPSSVNDEHSDTDGWIVVRAASSGAEYRVPFWGRVNAPTTPRWIFTVRGDGQIGRVSTMLARSLGAQVTDAAGIAIAGAAVHFEITRGAGVLSATDALTDEHGIATVQLQLPDTPGLVEVKASGGRNDYTYFWATARLR